MKPGRLNERIDIVRVTLADDGYGGRIPAEEVVASCWASVTSRASDETPDMESIKDIDARTFTIRRRSGITSTDHVVWRGTRYNITGVTEEPGQYYGRRSLYMSIYADLETIGDGRG